MKELKVTPVETASPIVEMEYFPETAMEVQLLRALTQVREELSSRDRLVERLRSYALEHKLVKAGEWVDASIVKECDRLRDELGKAEAENKLRADAFAALIYEIQHDYICLCQPEGNDVHAPNCTVKKAMAALHSSTPKESK